MNNISLKHSFLAVLTALASLTACDDASYEGYSPSMSAHYLYIETATGTFEASSDLEENWSVYSVATPWRFEGYDTTWLTFSPASGNGDANVSVTAAVNTMPTVRTSTVTFVSANPDFEYSRSKLITQTGAEAYIRASETSIEFAAGTGEKRVAISCNIAWETTSNVDWLSVKASDDGKSVVIVASENLTGSTRTGKVYVTSADNSFSVSATINVTQSAPSAVETTNTLEVDCPGGTYTMSVTSEVAWTATTTESWMLISPTEGAAGTTELVLQVAPNSSANDRTGYVSIKIGGTEQARIVVMQKGLFVEVSPIKLTFTADAQQQTLSVKSNVTWSVLEKPDWLTTSASGATGDAELTLTASANLSDTPRTGTLKVGQENSSITAQVSITQNAKYFNVVPTTFAEIPSRGGTHTIHIATDDQWTAVSTSSWMQMSQRSGKGDIDMTMTIPDNPSLEGRGDTTIFTPLYAQPVRIITQQAGRYLSTDVTAITFYSKGGTSDVVTVTTDASYTVTSSVAWLTIQQTGNTFTVAAAENTDEADREGIVVIAMTGLQSGETFKQEIPVKQKRFSPGISVETFDSEKAWDIIISGKVTITVTGFTVEKSWD